MRRPFLLDFFLIALFTALSLAVMGYHPGVEDDAVYLSAIQSDLNPSLYPHDASFFKIQLQATVFDEAMAWFVDTTHMSIYWAELLWQFAALMAILWASLRIGERLFKHPLAAWGGVAMVAAMFTLPVAGTALTIADQYLHPRLIATALILLAVDGILAGKRIVPTLLLLVGFLFHPIMAAFGFSFCAILILMLWDPAYEWLCFHLRVPRGSMALVTPLGWVFESPSASWNTALHTRRYFFLTKWTWYEWLGALAPVVLFYLLWRYAHRNGKRLLARVALTVTAFAVFQFVFAIAMLSTPALVRFTPLQPMRFLHLVYLFMVLLGGCLLGEHFLDFRLIRWAVYLVVINGAMFAGQLALFPASPHFERPGDEGENAWLQAFQWVRQNTPENAFFVMNPYYMAAEGEDYHSFRALAERSQMADAIKDGVVSTQVPELAPYWLQAVEATRGWQQFKLADFERLRENYGVDWALVDYPPPAGLDCRWHNRLLSVCRIPQIAEKTLSLTKTSLANPGRSNENRGRPHGRYRRRG
ncbi:MAG: hypothetical protein KGN79_07205 [Acidobacteriota bacterium]|nr:hypothetical protein [Acidobacteriota bacterium]